MSDETIKLTADVAAISTDTTGEPYVLLIRRGWDPYEGCYALPGGHVDVGEHVEQAASRELAEETGISVSAAALSTVGTYHAPGRDPRGRYVTCAYWTEVAGLPTPVAADDAATAEWMPLQRMQLEPMLAFDHQSILIDTVAAWQRHAGMPSVRNHVGPGGTVSVQTGHVANTRLSG